MNALNPRFDDSQLAGHDTDPLFPAPPVAITFTEIEATLHQYTQGCLTFPELLLKLAANPLTKTQTNMLLALTCLPYAVSSKIKMADLDK